MQHAHRVIGHAEGRGGDLSERCLMPLAVGGTTRRHGNRPVAVDADRAMFPSTAADFDEGGQPDPQRHGITPGPALRLFAPQGLIASQVQGLVQGTLIVPGVVFVTTAWVWTCTLGTRYTPPAISLVVRAGMPARHG